MMNTSIPRKPLTRMVATILQDRVATAFMLLFGLIIFGSIINPGFLSFLQIMNILQASFFLGLVALGQTVVVISGKEGLDLSVGGMLTVGMFVGAAVLNGNDAYLIPAFFAVIAAGFMLGLVNGFGVSYLGIAPLIMTFAWYLVIMGLMLIVTKGRIVGESSPFLSLLGQGSCVFNVGSGCIQIPWVVPIWIVIIAIVSYIMKSTALGATLYGIGANDRAAKLLGIKTKRFRMLVYGVSGALSALSGLFLLGFVNNPNMSMEAKAGYMISSIIAVLIGGIEFNGGQGRYLGAVAGSIFLVTLTSILRTMQMADGSRRIITAIVLLVLLIAYTRRKEGA
jgi:ribose transport system permease protein